MEDYSNGISETEFEKKKDICRNDPMFEEFCFCDNCLEKALTLITYIRELENAQIVAQQALQTISSANDKLTTDRDNLRLDVERLQRKVKGKEDKSIKDRMKDLRDAELRFQNRDKLVMQ